MADDDKTVFGGKVPGPGGGKPAQGGDRTVIGGALPPQRPHQPQGGGGERTMIGGALPPQRPQTPQQPYRTAPTGPASHENTWLGGPVAPPPQQPSRGAPQADPQAGFFPEMPRERAPQQPQRRATPRIALDEALRAKGLGKGSPNNPLMAAAANLLILFGRLRTGMVDLQVAPLMNHVVNEIQDFEANAVQRGADPQQARIGTYILCGTADDIVQNLPGANPGDWLQYSMVARFFQKRDSGVGFFQEVQKAMQAPAVNYDLLELMMVCLSLGFEGQYRTMQGGVAELNRIRADIYETLRHVKARPEEDIAVNWAAVPMTKRRRFGGFPIWIAAAVAGALVVAGYAGLSTWINREGGAVEAQLRRMHPNIANISLVRNAPVQAFVAPPNADQAAQLERIRASLSDQIADGSVEVGEKGDFIFIRVGNTLLFNSGSADVRPEFAELAAHITDTLNSERGPIRVLGYTDDIQPSGRGQFKTNLDLSVARAEGVANVLRTGIDNEARISVEGKGEADPIADNGTPEGRALNRRVEILMAKEGTFEAAVTEPVEPAVIDEANEGEAGE